MNIASAKRIVSAAGLALLFSSLASAQSATPAAPGVIVTGTKVTQGNTPGRCSYEVDLVIFGFSANWVKIKETIKDANCNTITRKIKKHSAQFTFLGFQVFTGISTVGNLGGVTAQIEVTDGVNTVNTSCPLPAATIKVPTMSPWAALVLALGVASSGLILLRWPRRATQAG